MLKSVRSSVKTADCLIIVIDGDAKETAEKDFENLLDVDVIGKVPTAVCVNKCDRIKDVQRIKELMKYFRRVEGISEVIPISALNDTGVKEVVQWAKGKLPVGPSYFPRSIYRNTPSGSSWRKSFARRYSSCIRKRCRTVVGLGGGVEGEETAGEGFDSGDDLRREAIAGWYRRRRRRRGDEKVEHGSEERYRSVFREECF